MFFLLDAVGFIILKKVVFNTPNRQKNNYADQCESITRQIVITLQFFVEKCRLDHRVLMCQNTLWSGLTSGRKALETLSLLLWVCAVIEQKWLYFLKQNTGCQAALEEMWQWAVKFEDGKCVGPQPAVIREIMEIAVKEHIILWSPF